MSKWSVCFALLSNVMICHAYDFKLHEKYVSIIGPIARPEVFQGRRLCVIGFVSVEFERNVVYLNYEDFEHASPTNALWLSVAESDAKKYGVFHRGTGSGPTFEHSQL